MTLEERVLVSDTWFATSTRLRRLDLWQVLVLVTLAVTVARGVVLDEGIQPVLQVMQFGLLALATLLLVTGKTARPSLRTLDPAAFSLIGLVTLSVASSLYSVAPGTTAARSVVFAIMTAFVLASALWRWTSVETISRDITLVLYAVIGVSLAGLMLGLAGAPIAWGEFGRFRGLAINANVAGWLACYGFVFSYGRALAPGTRRRYLVAIAVLCWVIMVMCDSRGALLGAAAAVPVMHIRIRRGWIMCSVAIVATVLVATVPTLIWGGVIPDPTVTASVPPAPDPSVAASVAPAPDPTVTASVAPAPELPGDDPVIGRTPDPTTDMTSGRADLVKLALQRWRERPLLGHGYGTVSLTEGFAGKNGMTPHNSVLSAAVELGGIGAVLFMVWLSVAGLRAWRSGSAVLSGLAVAVIVSTLMESALFALGGPLTLVGWIALGSMWASGANGGAQ